MNTLNKSKLATVFFGGFLCGVTYLISCGKVNTNEAGASGGTTRYVKANGVSIGEFLSVTLARSYVGSDNIVALTAKGYLLPITLTGDILANEIVFSASNCQGTPYTSGGVHKTIIRNGNSLFYISGTSTTISSFSYQSVKGVDGNCTNMSNSTGPVISLDVNDSNITGVSQTSFTPPITIE